MSMRFIRFNMLLLIHQIYNHRKPQTVLSRTDRLGHVLVNMVRGIAANNDPAAYAVMSCPAMEEVTLRPALISGRRPAGIISVRMQINPVIVRASRASTGSF